MVVARVKLPQLSYGHRLVELETYSKEPVCHSPPRTKLNDAGNQRLVTGTSVILQIQRSKSLPWRAVVAEGPV